MLTDLQAQGEPLALCPNPGRGPAPPRGSLELVRRLEGSAAGAMLSSNNSTMSLTRAFSHQKTWFSICLGFCTKIPSQESWNGEGVFSCCFSSPCKIFHFEGVSSWLGCGAVWLFPHSLPAPGPPDQSPCISTDGHRPQLN